jgi:hypothetical protein
MSEKRAFFHRSLRPKEFVIVPGVVLDSLALEHNRSIPSVANKIAKSNEYVGADRQDLEWFMQNPDEAVLKYGKPRRYQRIVFFGSAKIQGFETLKFDEDLRRGKGEFIPGSHIPLGFVWNATLGLAALREKILKD